MSSPISHEFVEEYQILYEKDPNSKVFAPLAEAYRQLNMLKEAHEICTRGVRIHPHFVSGRVTFAKVLMAQEDWDTAIENLVIAKEISDENILVHQLLGECYMKQKRSKEALHSLKKVLLLKPTDKKAAELIKKLESLTADEYEEDLFVIKPILHHLSEPSDRLKILDSHTPSAKTESYQLDRYLSLIDAYIVRDHFENAVLILEKAESSFYGNLELAKRRKILDKRTESRRAQSAVTEIENPKERRVATLELLLQRINERKDWAET